MAVMRQAPFCPKCGEQIKGKYKKNNPHMPFIGDTFLYWDYDGHKCKNLKFPKG